MAAVLFDELQSIAYADITDSYTEFGDPLTNNWRIITFINNSNGDMFISTDDSIDRIFVPANSFRLYDCATNASNVKNSDWFVLPIGTQFYIRYSTAPSSGAVYLEGVYSIGV